MGSKRIIYIFRKRKKNAGFERERENFEGKFVSMKRGEREGGGTLPKGKLKKAETSFG